MSQNRYVPDNGMFERNTMNILWMTLIIITLAQFIFYPFVASDDASITFSSFFFDNYTTINLFLILFNLALEAVIRLRRNLAEISIIIGVHLFTLVVVIARMEQVQIATVITLLPVILSIYYLRRDYIIYSFVMNVVFNVLILIINDTYDLMHVSMLIVIVSLALGTMMIGFGIMKRGIDLIASLEKSMKSEQEYMIKNIVMDRVSKLDPLTDLYNHKTFHEYFDRLIDHHGQLVFPLHLAVLDIDNFKQVNDTFGHAVGDIALKMVAEQIRKHTGPDDFAARYGGEEFVVLLTTVDDEEAYHIMEQLRASIAATPIPEMDGLCVTVSIGLHTYRTGDTKSVSFQRADQALYDAKRTGKNKLVVY